MSEVKVNKISPRTACGTTTLGDSGDTFTIPAGVTITNNGTAAGFGATGAASWDTTVKTTGFTAVSGVGYFVNTTAGAISVNLPAGTAGDVVAIKDYANTFDTNAVTLVQNGSDKIGGQAINATLNTEGIAVTLVFIDSTQGWLVTDDGLQSSASQAQYVTATGGTITTSGDFKIHTFTGPGTFTVTCVGNAEGSTTIDYMVVAGGGGGGGGYNSPANRAGGGGGAGGWRASSGTASGSYTAGPGPLTSPVSALPVTATGYPVTVGAGGAGGHSPVVAAPRAVNGSNSVFTGSSTITSAGGGFGSSSFTPSPAGGYGNPGGSGGGGSAGGTVGGCGGNGNTPPVSPPQGNNGGGNNTGPGFGGHGGGGATTVGTPVCIPGPTANGGPGGTGATSSITASPVQYAGGGGGGAGGGTGGTATGGASAGGNFPNGDGTAATANLGGGGGGGAAGSGTIGGTGGSGIVVIRYKFQ
jgi:hypothetical protein